MNHFILEHFVKWDISSEKGLLAFVNQAFEGLCYSWFVRWEPTDLCHDNECVQEISHILHEEFKLLIACLYTI